MASLLERKLVLVTGKGGTGKTTVACALGLIGAARGKRTLVVELGGQRRLPALFAAEPPPTTAEPPPSHSRTTAEPPPTTAKPPPTTAKPQPTTAKPQPTATEPQPTGEELQLAQGLWSVSIDPDRAAIDWLRALVGRVSARMLATSSTFRYFAAAAPGAKELVTMVKLLDLIERYELVVLDAPATGHALAMLRSPQTFSAIARAGPLATQSGRVRRLLEDRERCGYVAVTHGSEMAVTETLELEEQLRRLVDRDLDAVCVNGVLPRRFTREDMARLEPLAAQSQSSARRRAGGNRAAEEQAVADAAVHMARVCYERARVQQSQIARLRRQRFAGGAPPGVLTIPFQLVPEIDLDAVEAIASRLAPRV